MRLQIRGMGKCRRKSQQDESKDNLDDGLHGLSPLFLKQDGFLATGALIVRRCFTHHP
jgi:hypothetical protein